MVYKKIFRSAKKTLESFLSGALIILSVALVLASIIFPLASDLNKGLTILIVAMGTCVGTFLFLFALRKLMKYISAPDDKQIIEDLQTKTNEIQKLKVELNSKSQQTTLLSEDRVDLRVHKAVIDEYDFCYIKDVEQKEGIFSQKNIEYLGCFFEKKTINTFADFKNVYIKEHSDSIDVYYCLIYEVHHEDTDQKVCEVRKKSVGEKSIRRYTVNAFEDNSLLKELKNNHIKDIQDKHEFELKMLQENGSDSKIFEQLLKLLLMSFGKSINFQYTQHPEALGDESLPHYISKKMELYQEKVKSLEANVNAISENLIHRND